MTHQVVWHDSGREPRHPADPAFPDGIYVDMSKKAAVTCEVELPYPAKRCGHYMITCATCGLKVAVTTAGRADDPKMVKLPCFANQMK